MAIVIPSKSLYSPIENEKVRTPITPVSFSQIDTEVHTIRFNPTIIASTNEFQQEDVIMPIGDYYKSTLKPMGNLSIRVDYHIGEEGKTQNFEQLYSTYEEKLSFDTDNTHATTNWRIERDQTVYLVYIKLEIFENEKGLCYYCHTWTGKGILSDSTKYKEDITLDNVYFGFNVSAVRKDLKEQTVRFGAEGKNGFSLSSNELLQSSAMVDRGLSGIRFYGIERATPIDYDINEGYRYEYKVVQGDDVSSLLPITDETKRYVGWYHSDGKTIVSFYNLSENTEINKHNADFIRDVGFYWGIDYNEIPCTYSFMEDLLSVYIDSEVDLSLGFRVVLDFGENGWRKTENLSSVIAKGVLEQYGKGKETARIRCSTNDYYDENDELAISPTGKNELPMLFSINDEVIPMVTPDRAMSYYKDETRKVFRVVGVRFENRGALWQELTLQEK